MSVLREFEIKVLHLLASGVLSPRQLESLVGEGELVGYEYTGGGYILSMRHQSLPTERSVCHRPIVTGRADGITCGFVLFIEGGGLTIDCHTWGEVEVPEDFRDRDVRITAT